MQRRSSNNTTGFIDLLFNSLLGILALMLIVMVLINPKAKQNDVELKAEFIVTLSWDKDSYSDVDLWVRDPRSYICFYGNRDVKLMNLDRDDRGRITDTQTFPDGSTVELKENWEHVTIRKVQAGTYTVNAHLFHFSAEDRQQPIKVLVKLEKLNPYKLVYIRELIMTSQGEELTAFNFELDSRGNVIHLDSDAVESLVSPARRRVRN